jgi:Ca-activated chloride channel family protein
MEKRYSLFLLLVPFLLCQSVHQSMAQGSAPNIHVNVELVQLNVAVMDHKGKYISSLRPSDFAVTEDGIPQRIATFGEGNEATRTLLEPGADKQAPPSALPNLTHDDSSQMQSGLSALGSAMVGANVFILFDTSNYMYHGFVYAQDAIAEFVRSLEGPDKVAFYSYSRDLSRAATLTADRSQVLRGVRSTVAGDDAALYNSLLMTVKDAGQYSGRKVVVVFSNGPDNSSMVPPEDVAELAQSEGIPIYMISTRDAKVEPINSVVFQRMSAATGGEAYFAKDWKDQQKAFASIREDLAHLYSISYYPQPNPNRGWRAISVRLLNDRTTKYRIRTRDGYRPLPAPISERPGS